MSINLDKENIISRMEQPGSVHQLALLRILLGLHIFYKSGSQLLHLLKQLEGPAETKNIFPDFINQGIDTIAVPYLQPITQVLSIFLILGFLTRYILPVLFFSYMLLFSFWYSRYNAPIPWLYIWFPLLILNFTKCSDALSLDKLFRIIKPLPDPTASTYRWPIEMAAGWFAYIYFASGLAKLLPVFKVWLWMDGGTSQDIIYHRFLDSMYFYLFHRPLFDYTLHHWLFSLLSICALLIELFCILIVFTRRYNGLILFLVLSMHVFLYLVGVMGFLQPALILSIVLIRPSFFTSPRQDFSMDPALNTK